jgi:transcription elongation factor
LKVVQGMKFSSENELDAETAVEVTDDRMVLFDVEVYPNLFVICWKYRGGNEIVKMINPKPHEVAELFV